MATKKVKQPRKKKRKFVMDPETKEIRIVEARRMKKVRF